MLSPVLGISNIYLRVLQIGVGANFIFKTRIFTQLFSKLTPPRSKQPYNGHSWFLKPSFRFFIPVPQSSLNLAGGFLQTAHAKTPMPNATILLNYFISRCVVPINFHIRDTCKWTPLPLSASTILLRVRTMYASHWRASTDCRTPIRWHDLEIIPTESRFRNIVQKTLQQMNDIEIACRKRSIFTNFNNKFRKGRHACLSSFTSSM